jgi:hypothetical protein
MRRGGAAREARNRLGVVEQLGKTGTNETGRAASEDRNI